MFQHQSTQQTLNFSLHHTERATGHESQSHKLLLPLDWRLELDWQDGLRLIVSQLICWCEGNAPTLSVAWWSPFHVHVQRRIWTHKLVEFTMPYQLCYVTCASKRGRQTDTDDTDTLYCIAGIWLEVTNENMQIACRIYNRLRLLFIIPLGTTIITALPC